MSIYTNIQAVFTLQKFVRTSRLLLPLYIELIEKETLNEDDLRKKKRIEAIYENFRVNPDLSIVLINSKIIDYIKSLFIYSKSHQQIKNTDYYHTFIEESDVLIQKWNKHLMN
jgi:hypothetical protein